MTQTRRRFMRTAGAALATVPVLAATTAKAQTTHTVRIQNFSFNPANITIASGDTVVWVNEDDTRHSALDLNNAFDTGLIAPGASASLRFGGAGTFNYRCRPHGNMRGTITVT